MSDQREIQVAFERGGHRAVLWWVVRELFAAIGIGLVLVLLIRWYFTGLSPWTCSP